MIWAALPANSADMEENTLPPGRNGNEIRPEWHSSSRKLFVSLKLQNVRKEPSQIVMAQNEDGPNSVGFRR
jgi:hypothetical protein